MAEHGKMDRGTRGTARKLFLLRAHPGVEISKHRREGESRKLVFYEKAVPVSTRYSRVETPTGLVIPIKNLGDADVFINLRESLATTPEAGLQTFQNGKATGNAFETTKTI